MAKFFYRLAKLSGTGGQACLCLIHEWGVNSLRNYRCSLMLQVSYEACCSRRPFAGTVGSSSGTGLSAGWCWQFGNPENLSVGGPSHLVLLKLMPQVVPGAGCMSSPALPHSRVVGPCGACVFVRSPRCLALIPPVPLLRWNGCVQVVKGGFQPWENEC